MATPLPRYFDSYNISNTLNTWGCIIAVVTDNKAVQDNNA